MKRSYLILTLVPVLLLSGCKWFGSSTKDASTASAIDAKMATASNLPADVLAVWADGSALLTQKEFDEVLDMAMKEQPELKGMAPAFMPMLKQNLLNSLVQHKIIAKYIEEAGVNKTADYKAKVDQIVKAVIQKVNVDFFAKEFDSAVTEKEKREYYEANKDRFAVIAKGGVKAAGVKFDKEADAKAFLAKVAGKVAEFDKLVKLDAKLSKTLQDFNYVSSESRQIEQALRDGIIAIAKAPSIVIIKVDDKTFWVVKATDKKESKYHSYDELKDQLEGAVKQAKQGEALMKKLNELQQKYGIAIKENAFAPVQGAQATDVVAENDVENGLSDDSSQDLESSTRAA